MVLRLPLRLVFFDIQRADKRRGFMQELGKRKRGSGLHVYADHLNVYHLARARQGSHPMVINRINDGELREIVIQAPTFADVNLRQNFFDQHVAVGDVEAASGL